MVRKFVSHPKFDKNTLFPHYEYNHILLNNFISINDIEMLDILIDNTNREFVYAYLANYYTRLFANSNPSICYQNRINNFKIILSFLINKINDNNYILSCIIDICSSNEKLISYIYDDIINPIPFFDYVYNMNYYDTINFCKKIIQLPSTNITNIFNEFYKGKYVKLTKLFLNYF
jgi:hypothetical protein